MSLAESGHSSRSVSIGQLFAGAEPAAPDPGLDLRDLAERIVVGGWPGLVQRAPDAATIATQGYLDGVRRVDIGRLDGSRRDPENIGRVLRSLARNTSTQASARAIAADVAGVEGGIDYHTVLDYISALSRLFIVEDLPAWSPALRSRAPVRSAATRHFTDPSLAAAALGTGVDRLLGDPETLGLLFESLVVRDLRVYGQTIGASVSHYRDATGAEADAVLELRDGRWAAIEVKLGQQRIDEAARSLARVVDHVDPARHGAPVFTAVVTGWGYAYRRRDGVFVIPIGTLTA